MAKQDFLVTSKGEAISLYTISNGRISAEILDWGATIYSLNVPDKNGNLRDVTLGYRDRETYEGNNWSFGAVIGRYANRIKDGKLSLDGVNYQLPCNSDGNCLHGNGEFAHSLWQVASYDEKSVTLQYFSPDGSNGFPANMQVVVKYSVTDDDALQIDYEATADRRTVVNLTNHVYFNLDGKETVFDHELEVNAEEYTITDSNLIPTGEIGKVESTLMDLRKRVRLGDVLPENGGFDDNFILQGGLEKVQAVLYSPNSGIELSCYTSEPGVQVYNANTIGEDIVILKNGKKAENFSAVCLEAQHFADSPNHKNFPSTVLNPCEVYKQTTIYKFKVK